MHETRIRIICLAVVATLLFLTLAPSAHAWGPTGHRVVGEIAQRHLTPAARARVSRLLGGRTLAEVANWPDELRSDPRFDKYKPLHYATVKDGLASYRDAEKARCGDLVAAIDAFTAFLRTGSREALYSVKALSDKSDGAGNGACNPQETDPLTRDTALRSLVHLMGDLHQPLHVGGTDQGGNKVDVNWMERWKTNLHSTWDDEMVDFERLDYKEYARFLDRASPAAAKRWLTGDTISYADEAVAMRSKLYEFPDGASGTPAIPKIYYQYTGAQRGPHARAVIEGRPAPGRCAQLNLPIGLRRPKAFRVGTKSYSIETPQVVYDRYVWCPALQCPRLRSEWIMNPPLAVRQAVVIDTLRPPVRCRPAERAVRRAYC